MPALGHGSMGVTDDDIATACYIAVLVFLPVAMIMALKGGPHGRRGGGAGGEPLLRGQWSGRFLRAASRCSINMIQKIQFISQQCHYVNVNMPWHMSLAGCTRLYLSGVHKFNRRGDEARSPTAMRIG